MMKGMIYHWLSLRYVCYVCYGEKDGPEFFLVTFVSSGVRTLNVFSIRYIRYADFCMGQEKPVTFVSYCKWWKGWFIIDFPFVTFVTFVTGKKMAQNFLSLPLFLLESWLSMYFPFVTFVTLIFAWARKSLLRSFHIVNDERDDLSLIFPSLRLLRLLRGKRWPSIFSRYLCFFWSQDSQCIFHSLHSLHWFLHGPGKACYVRFIL